MDIELKNKWIGALRGGKYEQTNGTLRDSTGFCCLGVLCDVIDSSGWVEDNYFKFPEFNKTQGGYFDTDICESIGLCPDVQHEAMRMNDAGKNFIQIATYLESEIYVG
jgi:hypothetical protein